MKATLNGLGESSQTQPGGASSMAMHFGATRLKKAHPTLQRVVEQQYTTHDW
jgi:hypothetical protein